ncbi:hypothetical protein CEP52_010868 [Fusarium oligoseptatum]|uniref:non-specific serine/threonine protein kinase n=1 Tax=Fusarium oligoseptatum TaxID=2604345 RepID=A0A428T678_9HYPO|nr:hypothetical protein CEP52_010868 [Fusarium oligoseptatum]
MSTTQNQAATGQPFDAGPQDEVSRDSQQTRPGKGKGEAQIDAHLSSLDSRVTDPAGIQRRTLECRDLFESSQKNPHLSGDDWIDKMSAEFNWWSLGIGAAKAGHSSLDYRVQTRDDVRSTLINLLESLAISLKKYIDAATQPSNLSQFTTPPPKEQDLERAADYGSDPQPSDDDSLISEQRFYIETTIRFLSQISISIRKSGTKFRHQRVDKHLATREAELKEFKDYLLNIVFMSSEKPRILHRVSQHHSLTRDPLWMTLWITLKAYLTDIQRLTPVQKRLIHANLVRRNRFDLGHVAEDLSPYVCVYDDCDSPDSMYVTTAEWKKHIRDKHSRARWICDACWQNSSRPEKFEFDSQEEWHRHTLAEHGDEVDESDMPDLTELSQRTGVPPIACPLCVEDTSLRNPETDKHLAEHIHSFALQALPWDSIDCDDKSQVSVGAMGSDIRKSHGLGDIGQSTVEEPQDDSDGVTAFQNLVSTIRNRSSMILRKGQYHPAASISVLLVTMDAYFDRPSVRFHDYPPSFKPEILACLARLASVMQGYDDQTPSRRYKESMDFHFLDGSTAPSSLPGIQSLEDTGVSEASDRLRSNNTPNPEDLDMDTSILTLGRQLGYLMLQFHGQDGTGNEEPHYLPRYSLEAFWKAHSISAILSAYSINISQEVILQSFLCTFSLLVYINKADFLEWFVKYNMNDIVFPLQNRPPSWPDTPTSNSVFNAITESQWRFFPVAFGLPWLYKRIFGPRHIFPIRKEELIAANDMTRVHKIEIESSEPITRVRKTYNESGRSQYEREVETFTSLQSRSSPNIIGYHGCYQQQRLDGTITYNLILGFVDGANLEEFYTAMNPPRSLPDTNKIWNAFCGVLEGLHHLHFPAIDTDFQIIHQDIKPDNLLVSKTSSSQPYVFRLVITDFGYSHTKAPRSNRDTWGIDSHRGQVYGAPESSHHADYTHHGRTHITTTNDIWSLGCVMSETAVWIKSGRQGLENYRNGRIAETRTLPRFDQASRGRCFHDGAQALSAVRTAHDWIRSNSSHDIVTLQVLEMIETSMLVFHADRQDAHSIHERLVQIIHSASSNQEYSSSHSLSLPSASSGTRIQIESASSGKSQSYTSALTLESSTHPSPRIELPGSPPDEQAWGWYEHAKNNRKPVDRNTEDVVRQLGNNVKGRGHIFFVDVSQTMGLYFQEIKEKFQILAYLAKKETPQKLLSLFNEQNWGQLSFEDRIGTFIDQIVIPRLSSLRQRLGLKKPKNLTIFVLTDGRWGEGKEGAAGVENPIMRLINLIHKKGLSRTQVAIQFLRFGDDPHGKRYLTFLDHFGTQYKCDCVDTKPIDGNIFDMFIGPISPGIDGEDEVDRS